MVISAFHFRFDRVQQNENIFSTSENLVRFSSTVCDAFRCRRGKQFSRIRPQNLPSGTPASIFFVHLSSTSPLWSLNGVSLRLHRRLAEAAGMQRVNHWQQKLPLPLHRTEMLEASEIFVCSILHTFWRVARTQFGEKFWVPHPSVLRVRVLTFPPRCSPYHSGGWPGLNSQ